MKICLVRPPSFVSGRNYPLNIEYIISSLKQDNHEVGFVDGELVAAKAMEKEAGFLRRIVHELFVKQRIMAQQNIVDSFFEDHEAGLWELIAKQIISHDPDIIGFSCYTAGMSSTNRIIKKLRRGYNVKVPIVLGGIHPSSAPLETMAMMPEVDYLVYGEGEITAVELMRALSGEGGDLQKIQGLAWRKDGEVILNEPRKLMADLSLLPVLDFDFAGPDYTSYVILTSRGCPFNCKFCSSKTIWGRRVRYRPPWHIVQEVANLRRKTAIEVLRFGDDTFTLNRRHVEDITDGLEKAGLTDLRYSVGSRIDTLDKERLDLLKRMGVCTVSFGVETGSQKIADMIDKGIKLDDVVPVVKMANNMGIYTTTFFILNHPEETKEDMAKTRKLIKELNKRCPLNNVQLSNAIPYPATPWWEYCKDNGLLSKIDIYNESHKYNHQLNPLVNMSAETTETLMAVKSDLDRIELRHLVLLLFKRVLKRLVSNPGLILRRMKRILLK